MLPSGWAAALNTPTASFVVHQAILHVGKESSSLPLDLPSILLIDNVSSHKNYKHLKKVACHPQFDICHVLDVSGTHIYLLLGLANRSHIPNSGDQLVNEML